MKTIAVLGILPWSVYGFVPAVSGPTFRARTGETVCSAATIAAPAAVAAPAASEPLSSGSGVPEGQGTPAIRLTVPEKAKTVTYVANSATLSTFAEHGDEAARSHPFGSYVDYILDDKGWPVLLLSEQSLHTQNIKSRGEASLFVQLPNKGGESSAALSRVTLVGHIVPVEREELPTLRTAFSIVHPYSERLVESPKFQFCKLQPNSVYFVGGFGVLSKWIDVSEYESAEPDVLAHEVSRIVGRLNREHEMELRLVCKNVLGIDDVDQVTATTVDRLGVDLRVTKNTLTDEFRIGFRQKITSVEDAKSEVVKLFQEAWERENGYAWIDQLPPVIRYAEDILRKK